MSRAVSCPTVRVFVCVLGGVFGTLLLVPCLHKLSHSTPGVAGRTGQGGVWSCSPGCCVYGLKTGGLTDFVPSVVCGMRHVGHKRA